MMLHQRILQRRSIRPGSRKVPREKTDKATESASKQNKREKQQARSATFYGLKEPNTETDLDIEPTRASILTSLRERPLCRHLQHQPVKSTGNFIGRMLRSRNHRQKLPFMLAFENHRQKLRWGQVQDSECRPNCVCNPEGNFTSNSGQSYAVGVRVERFGNQSDDQN